MSPFQHAKTSALCLIFLLTSGWVISHAVQLAPAIAHEPVTAECPSPPPPPVCPPEGFTLVEVPSTPPETSMQEALEAIQHAQEALNKGPTP